MKTDGFYLRKDMRVMRQAYEQLRGVQVPQVQRFHDMQVLQLPREAHEVQVPQVQFRGTIMGKVATIFKVYTDNPDDAKQVSELISKTIKPQSIQLEEIAFGIKVIKVLFVHEDQDGSASYEEKLKAIKGVKEVEVAEESLL
ncbi:MAG: hypothetical protein KGH72_04560 [Candidatus Micrarchaeota archaeon]|nr:hypothetical protein [Candidatus Micrarchaeota archaeon]